ncbi:hypothetical protein [Nonomuraea indica]|uniref:hypothetical protein n=1 Tax=Nonomuraea indica TaxID=1581193 RepID=UPI001183D55E|nr:hypothetical protein [Nonomuraea indica]
MVEVVAAPQGPTIKKCPSRDRQDDWREKRGQWQLPALAPLIRVGDHRTTDRAENGFSQGKTLDV